MGLAWLHHNGLVHGNIKPSNVWITSAGVAKVWHYCEPGARTRAYASPEQLGGTGPLGPATDIYSWAVSVLHMIDGQVSWRVGPEAPRALARYIRSGPARRGIMAMPAGVLHILEACLKADPAQRPQSMDHVVAALEKCYQDALNEPYSRPAQAASPPSSAPEAAGHVLSEGGQDKLGPAASPQDAPRPARRPDLPGSQLEGRKWRPRPPESA